MCYGENNASHARQYLNSQLAALWHIAMDCIQHHTGDLEYALKPQESGYRYSFALAEYHFGKHRSGTQASIEDMMFHARFKAPTIDFVCNHVAQLNLHLEEGHYNLDHGRASDLTTANRDRNQVFSEMTVSFRVPIKTTGIRGVDSLIGNGEHIVNLFVLDYANASLVTILPSSGSAMPVPVVEYYLKHYLRFLLAAGHHVLYSLPDFHDEEHLLLIDFSWDAQMAPDLQEVHGISIDHVNTYLADAWQKAVMLSNEHRGQPPDRPAISLAEYRSTWTISSLNAQSLHFHLLLNAPQVAALCNDEVVIYFSVDEANFYEDDDFDQTAFQTFNGWKVAVLMNLFYESEDGDNIKRCRLDLQSARYMRQFSEFPGYDEQDVGHVECMDVLVDFLCGDYLTILENAQHHIIYHYDVRFPRLSSIFDGDSPFDEDETVAEWHHDSGVIDEGARVGSHTVSWKDITQHSDMCGFDEIIALSQAAINGHFRSCWTQSTEDGHGLWHTWGLDDYFKATFKPFVVRLLSDGSALLCISVTEGSLRLFKSWNLSADGEQTDFSDYRVIFEVKLKMADHAQFHDVGDDWRRKFEHSPAYNDHGARTGMEFRHIYLDVTNAEFVQDHSRFDSRATRTRKTIDKTQAFVTYIRDYYLPQLAANGDHILYTIPVWRNTAEIPSYGLTSVQFQMYSKESVTRQMVLQSGRVPEPVIVIMGMSGGRPFPASTLQFSSGWVARSTKASSYGTVGLSKQVFLEGTLLALLSKINEKTTIVPIFSGIEGNEWKLLLTTWEKHSVRQHKACPFTFDKTTPNEGKLRYQWDHHDTYNYEHRGGSYIMNGTYSVSCNTTNFVEIPTDFKHGTMEIKLWGQVELELSVNLKKLQWSSRSRANWQSTLAVYSEASGLTVKALCPPATVLPSQSVGQTAHALYIDAGQRLAEQMRQPIELTAIVQEFEQFCGVWKSCYPATSTFHVAHPVFNRNGDLLFEIRSHAPMSPTALGGSPASARKAPTRSGVAARERSAMRSRMFQQHGGVAAQGRNMRNAFNGVRQAGQGIGGAFAGGFAPGTNGVHTETYEHQSHSSAVHVSGGGFASRPHSAMSHHARTRSSSPLPQMPDIHIDIPGKVPAGAAFGPALGTRTRPTTPGVRNTGYQTRPTTPGANPGGMRPRTPGATQYQPTEFATPQPVHARNPAAGYQNGGGAGAQGGAPPLATSRAALRQQGMGGQPMVPPHLNPANTGYFPAGTEIRSSAGQWYE